MKKALVSLLLGDSIVTDKKYDLTSKELQKLVKEYPEEFKASKHYKVFENFSLSYDGITELEGTITNNTKYPIVGLDVYFTKDENIWGASSQEKDYREWNDVVLPNDTDELHGAVQGKHKDIKYIEFQFITEENKVINVKYNIKKDKFTVYESVDRSAINDIGRNDLHVVEKYYEEEVDIVW